jgi:hypothetical protein
MPGVRLLHVAKVMKKYKVMLEGHNFLIKIEDDAKKYGFFTTRVVEARDEEEAGQKAIEILRNDTDLVALIQNEESDSPTMFVEKVEELKGFSRIRVPRTGFVWFPDEGGGH